MTKTQFRRKTKSLKPELNKLIDKKIESLLNSGCVDLDQYENNYLLPKIFMSVMGEVIKDQFKPLTKEGLKEAKNLRYFI